MDKDLIKIILKGVAVAMGVSTFVLSILGNIEAENAIGLLAIGVLCLGILQFQQK